MTNGEKFKGAKERSEAFSEFCQVDCENCPCRMKGCNETPYVGAFVWLDLEAPAEEPLPCPFCKTGTLAMHTNVGVYSVWCRTCGYQSKQYRSEAEAIAAHNRVARAAKEASHE